MSPTASAPFATRVSILLAATSALLLGCHDHGSDTGGVGSGGTAIDVTAPTVLSVAPEAGDMEVSVGATVRARFSEAMDPNSIDRKSFRVSAGGSEIDGALSFDEVADTVTFSPTKPLPDGVTILAQLTTGITDVAGNGLEASFDWEFSTENLDFEAPRVTATLPEDGAMDFPVGGLISATFSEALNPSTVTVASFMVMNGNTPLAGFVKYNPATLTVTFAPAGALPSSAVIQGTITQGIQDEAGNALEAPFEFSFTTEAVDSTPPAVISTVPSDQLTGVPVATVINATFSEALDASTVSNASLVVTDAGAPIPGVVSYDPATFTVGFVPSAPLPFGTTLRADVPASVTDLAGNPPVAPFVWTFTTELGDTTPPTVTAVDPVDQASDVPQNGLITATFSENVDAVTVHTGNFLVSSGGAPLQGIVAYDPATFTATFAPSVPLPINSLISARLTSVIADPSGNRMEAPFEWSFTTATVDVTPPLVTAISPLDLAANVPAGTAVTATFSEAMDPASLTPSTFTLTANGALVPATLMYDSASFTATLRPDTPLPFGTIVRADVNAGILDLAGNALASSRVWTFTTELGDTTPPTVVSTQPMDGTTNFPLGGLISATFSEDIDPATVNVASFSLTSGGAPLAGFVSYDPATLTATFAPAAALPSNATIDALLTQGIRDVAGNALASPASFSVTTEAVDTTPPGIVSVTPPDQGTGVSTLAPVSAVFSEALDPNTVTASAFTVSRAGVPVPGDVSYDPLTFTATFTSSAPFPTNTTLRVDVRPTIQDLAGNALASQAIWTFTTDVGDTTPPLVTAVDPADLSSNVALGGLISATFSEDIDPASISAGTFLVMEGGASLPGIIGYDPATFTATFAPSVPLPPNATIEGRLTTVITDLAGNALAAPFDWSFSTVSVDNMPPTVVSTSPGDLEVGVPVNAAVTATFSEAIQPATLTNATFSVTTGGAAVPGTLSYDPGSFTATFTPSMPLGVGATFRADVRTGITDLAGNALAAARVWTFTSELGDTTPPAVVSTVPTAGSTGFSVGGMISATFSEDLDPSTVNVASFQLMDGAQPIAGFVVYDPQTFTATFAPAVPLPTISTITVLLTRGLRDVAGNALAAPFQFDFDTEAIDATPPAIVATTPADQEGDISVGTSVTATFSEALNPATITGSSFSVSNAGAAIAGSVSYDPGSFVATFTPAAPLPNGTTLRADISSSVADPAGNTLAAPAVWTFTTELGDTTPPTVTSVSPPDQASGVAQSGLISATFSEEIDVTTLNAGTFQVTGAGASLPGIVGYDAATLTATFAPSAPLPPNANLVARLSDLIADPSGNRLAAPFDWSFTTVSVDNVPPTVVTTFPGDFDTNVPVNAAVTATFSEAIDTASLTSANFELTENGMPLTGSLSYDPGTLTATFTPSAPFSFSANIRADVRTGITDLAGNALAAERIWTFTTDPGDVTPPFVVSTDPMAGSIDFPTGGMVTVTFSEDLDPSSVDAGSVMLMDGSTPLAGFVGYDPSSFTATFAAAAALPSGTVIDVTLTQAIRDLAGNALGAPFQFAFTTEDVDGTPPEVTSMVPTDNATQVGVTTAVSATFSEALDAATVTDASFRVSRAGAAIPGAVLYDPSAFTVTFTPSGAYPSGTTIRVDVADSVADLAGNTLASSVIWTFTTDLGDLTPPEVTSVDPQPGEEEMPLDTSISATFSEPIDPTTLDVGTFGVTAAGGAVPGDVSYDPGTRTATFVPSAPLPPSAIVVARLSAVIADLAGNRLVAPFEWSFNTESVDMDPPTVVSVDPGDEEAGVELKRSINAVFSEDLEPASVNAGTVRAEADGVSILGQVSYSASDQTVTLEPDFGLPGGTEVTVTLTTGIRDAAGNPLAADFTSVFATAYPRYAYSANLLGNSITQFRIDAETGRLENRRNAAAGLAPRAVALDPELRFAYSVNSGSDDISRYTLDATTGELTFVGTTLTGGLGGRDIELDPLGQFLYVVNEFSSDVSQFAVDPQTGDLTPITSPAPTGIAPRGITINRDGTAAYVVNDETNDVTVFSLDPGTGILGQLGANVPCGVHPQGIVIEPCGRFAYVANEGSNDVSAFSIDEATGALTRIIVDIDAGNGPRAVDVDPTGRFAYVPSEFSDDLMAFSIDQVTGALFPIGSPVAAGDRPIDVRVDASGRFVYVASYLDSSVLSYSIDPASGALTPLGTVRTAEGTRGLELTPPSDAPATPTPLSVYTANFGSDDVTNLSVDSVTGLLTSAGQAVLSGGEPRAVAVHPSGRFVYVVNSASDSVTPFLVDATDGSLTPISAPVLASTDPRDLTIEASGRFLYVANGGSNDITTFAIDLASGGIIEKDTEILTGGLEPHSLTTDPAGRFLFVANDGTDNVSTFLIDQRQGLLTPLGSPIPAGNGPQDIHVHPTGRFAYVSNRASDDVTTFFIDPVTGALAEVGTEVAAGDGPRALAVDPTGRFAFVVSEFSNDITLFDIDQATGALTPIAGPSPAGLRPVDVTIDHSGRFLYLASFNSSSLSTYSIDSDSGALTPLGINIPGGSNISGLAVRNRDQ